VIACGAGGAALQAAPRLHQPRVMNEFPDIRGEVLAPDDHDLPFFQIGASDAP
jgi:hypothetical protein